MIKSSDPFVSAMPLAQRNDLIAVQSTRHGGVSPSPYETLNLGLYTPDKPDHVQANRRRFFRAVGANLDQIVGARQVHGRAILRVDTPGEYDGYDGFITRQKGIALTITVADCCPVLLYDPVQQAIGAVHAGWRGTVAGIASNAVEAMVDAFGTRPADLIAYVGVCIDRSSYEVDADVADHFSQAYKLWDEDRKKYYLDIKKANRDQLIDAGLAAGQVGLSPWCTYRNNEHFFSHRREKGRTGRGMALIAMR